MSRGQGGADDADRGVQNVEVGAVQRHEPQRHVLVVPVRGHQAGIGHSAGEKGVQLRAQSIEHALQAPQSHRLGQQPRLDLVAFGVGVQPPQQALDLTV